MNVSMAMPLETVEMSACDVGPLSATSTLHIVQPQWNNLIIFDWDDTLLPSTFLTHQQGLRCSDTFPLPEDILDSLQKLENMVICTLSEASRRGKVVIVTNAEDGWIEFSAQRFMPNLLPFLFQNAIRVISARSSFEDEFPDAPVEWKLQAFAQETRQFFPRTSPLNLIALGDSECERLAGHALVKKFPFGSVHTVKFIERPNTAQLTKQLELVSRSLNELCSTDGRFDINLVV